MRFTLPDVFPESATIGYGMRLGDAGGVADVPGVPLTTVEPLENPAIEIEESVPIVAYTDTISVMLPVTTEGNTINAIKSLSVGSQAYSPGDVGALSPGEFFYDSSTQQLTVKPAANTSPIVGTSIKYTAIQKKTVTESDRYNGPIPQFFKDWNVRGPVPLSRAFGQSPTGSCSFQMDTDEWKARRCDLAEGTEILWRGHYYGTGDVSESEDIFNGKTTVTVQLRGANDHKLDEQILLRSNTLSLTGGSSASDKSVTNIAIADLFTRGGMDYSGPSITRKVAKDRDIRDSVIGSSLLSYSRSANAFAYLDGKGIEFREWLSGTVHNISSTEIIGYASGSPSPIDIAHNMQGNKLDDHYLAAEYKNTRLDLDESEGADSGDAGRTNTRQVVKTGDSQIGIPPSGVDRSQHSAHFDQGGPTKECLTETYENGQLVGSEFEKWGYVYKVSDFATWSNDGTATSPVFLDAGLQPRTQGWQQVESHTVEITRDANGYPTEEKKTITRQRRYKEETDRRETLYLYAVATYGESSDPGIQASMRSAHSAALGMYDTFEVTEEEITTYEYGDLDDFYPDMPEKDDDEAARLFVERQSTTRRYYYETSDLTAITTDDDGNPVVGENKFFAGGDVTFSVSVDGLTAKTGEDFERIVERQIIYPTQGTKKSEYNPAEDLYIEKETLKRATGQGLRHVYEEPPTKREVRGKVPGAQRLEKFEDGNTPNVEEPENDEKITLLNTPNNGLSPTTDPIEGSISFPGAYKKSVALAAAKTDIAILNTQNTEVWSGVLLPANRIYDVGDVVRMDGMDYVVVGVDEEPNIETKDAIGMAYQSLTWGRLIEPDVTDTEVD